MTLTQETTITLTSPVNLRDMGGLEVADGVVAKGFAIRSDDLATITTTDADQLVQDGLAAVIDLRSRDEVFVTGRGPLLDQPVSYHHVPLLSSIRSAAGEDVEAAAVAAAAPARSLADLPPMSEMYVSLFETSPQGLVSSLAIMAHAPGATAFHCAAGKDRTGTLAAALLLALGAEDDVIVQDYQLTYDNMAGIHERTGSYMARVLELAGFDLSIMTDRPSMEEDAKRNRDAMHDTLKVLRARYSDPLTPLREAGLSNSLIEALRQRAVGE